MLLVLPRDDKHLHQGRAPCVSCLTGGVGDAWPVAGLAEETASFLVHALGPVPDVFPSSPHPVTEMPRAEVEELDGGTLVPEGVRDHHT